MEVMEIDKKNLLKAYDGACDKTRDVLENLFGKDVFQPRKITDSIKTFDDAYAALPETDNDIIIYDKITEAGVTGHVLKYQQLVIIAKALNEGWTPDWADSSQYKYYCWFKASASGVGFSYHACVFAYSSAHVGSRLVFRSSELATFAGKQFESIYNEYLSL